jgi:quinol monooxygenase YgiN
MIVVSGTINIDPANNARMTELVGELVPPTRQEDGNLEYTYSLSQSNPGEWRVFEEWETEEALNNHMATPHMATFIGAMGDLGVSGVDISRYEVSEKSKLM